MSAEDGLAWRCTCKRMHVKHPVIGPSGNPSQPFPSVMCMMTKHLPCIKCTRATRLCCFVLNRCCFMTAATLTCFPPQRIKPSRTKKSSS